MEKNYLTKDNGCQIVEASSEAEKAAACNILRAETNLLWIINKPLPQYCIVDIQGMSSRPQLFNHVAFYCWHQYLSNPALIELALQNTQGVWKVIAKIRLQRTSEWQHFKIKQVFAKDLKMLKVTILENFGDESVTYLNKIMLGYKEQSRTDVSESMSRDKIFSEYTKLTSTERELKGANEQIRILLNENRSIRETFKQQSDVIIKLQDTIKKLAKHVDSLHKTQESQAAKIAALQRRIPEQGLRNQSRHRSRKGEYDDQSGASYDLRHEDKQLADRLNGMINAMTGEGKKKGSTKQLYGVIGKSNNKSSIATKTLVQSKQSKLLRSDNELSDYSDSQQLPRRKDSVANRADCLSMLQKMQKLIAMRQQKKSQLRQRSNYRQQQQSYK